MPKKTKHSYRWPDPKAGPWKIETTAEFIGGRWELVGLNIQAADAPIPLTSTVLKRLHLPERLNAHKRAKHLELLAPGLGWEIRLTSGSPGYEVRVGGRKVSTPEAERIRGLMSRPESRKGRPLHWTPVQLAEVARIYLDALKAGKHPTAAVASHYTYSASGAAKVVKLARAARLLPPAIQGKAGWIDMPPMKIAKQSKERKR